MENFNEINFTNLDSKEMRQISGGDSLWDKFVDYVVDQMFPPEHDHDTCGMTPYPGGGHLIGSGVDR